MIKVEIRNTEINRFHQSCTERQVNISFEEISSKNEWTKNKWTTFQAKENPERVLNILFNLFGMIELRDLEYGVFTARLVNLKPAKKLDVGDWIYRAVFDMHRDKLDIYKDNVYLITRTEKFNDPNLAGAENTRFWCEDFGFSEMTCVPVPDDEMELCETCKKKVPLLVLNLDCPKHEKDFGRRSSTPLSQ